MPAAFNPDAPEIDQSKGPHPSHTAQGSRFTALDSRLGQAPIGATVTEAVAEWKRGTFTVEDLKQLSFAMGYQIVEGKESSALVTKIADLEKQMGELHTRAVQAESAFASAKQELDAAKAVKS